MASAVLQSTAVPSRSSAWVRALLITLTFVLVVQLCLAAVTRMFPVNRGPRAAVAAEITAIAVAEFVTVLAIFVLLRRRGGSLRDLGLWKRATAPAWVLGIALGILTAFWGLANPALHLPSKLGALLDTSPWHLYCALLAGTAAGFCEEIIFRGFMMQTFASAGFGRAVQVLASALFFGVAHAGLLRSGIVAGLLVIVPTAILGGLYSLIYLAGKRSLMPVIVSHFLNDAAAIPWIFLAIASRPGH